MKKLTVVLSFLLVAATSFAQDLDKVLKNHFEAIGQDKIVKAESYTMEGVIIQMGLEIPFKAFQERPGKMRTEGAFQGQTFIQAYNGEKGWTINPFMGSTEPQPMGPDELKGMQQQADMDGMLWNWEEKGYKLELMDDEDVEGTACYNVQVITPENDIYNYYIDKDSYLVLKVDAAVMVQGNVAESSTYMSNYMEVEGMAMAGTIETRSNGQTLMTMKIDKVTLNEDVEDALFNIGE